jgi:predicted SAM-dependent methyltransferase
MLVRIIKQLLPLGFFTLARILNQRREYKWVCHQVAGQITHYLETHPIRKLHIGSHEKTLVGWLNTDLCPLSDQVLFMDATQTFPFNTGTFDYVFHEHMIEHLDYKKGQHMLSECLRVLKPGGLMRAAFPDLRVLVELYRDNKTEEQEKYIAFNVDSYLPDIRIYEDVFVINNFVRNWGHQFIYDFKCFKRAIESVGFINVAQCDFGESPHEELRHLEYLTFERTFCTIVVEGTKPG